MIRAENIIKIFKTGDKELRALKGVSFSIASGEFVSIIGRSGSGKSTLLYQLGLLDRPTSGKVLIGNTEVTSLDKEERTAIRLNDLGYVFQDYALVPDLTALENVLVPLLMQGLTNGEAKQKAVRALTRVGLGERLGNVPSKLSGGEQQRVSIARAIAHDPKILFADEPTANLDNDTSLTVLKIFKELHASGQTIIMVTHEEEYARMSDRTITLFDGEVTKDERHAHHTA
jgi:putative ABC transport system ATP-binding protein